MFEITTETTIEGSPDAIWTELTHFPAHSAWNPIITGISGLAAEGSRLSITVQPPGGKAMSFLPRVLVATPGEELRWLGRIFMPGIFDGEHYFLIEPQQNGSCRFVHGERFTGLLVPFMKSRLDSGTRAGFEAMNDALKARVEARN